MCSEYNKQAHLYPDLCRYFPFHTHVIPRRANPLIIDKHDCSRKILLWVLALNPREQPILSHRFSCSLNLLSHRECPGQSVLWLLFLWNRVILHKILNRKHSDMVMMVRKKVGMRREGHVWTLGSASLIISPIYYVTYQSFQKSIARRQPA